MGNRAGAAEHAQARGKQTHLPQAPRCALAFSATAGARTVREDMNLAAGSGGWRVQSRNRPGVNGGEKGWPHAHLCCGMLRIDSSSAPLHSNVNSYGRTAAGVGGPSSFSWQQARPCAPALLGPATGAAPLRFRSMRDVSHRQAARVDYCSTPLQAASIRLRCGGSFFLLRAGQLCTAQKRGPGALAQKRDSNGRRPPLFSFHAGGAHVPPRAGRSHNALWRARASGVPSPPTCLLHVCMDTPLPPAAAGAAAAAQRRITSRFPSLLSMSTLTVRSAEKADTQRRTYGGCVLQASVPRAPATRTFYNPPSPASPSHTHTAACCCAWPSPAR